MYQMTSDEIQNQNDSDAEMQANSSKSVLDYSDDDFSVDKRQDILDDDRMSQKDAENHSEYDAEERRDDEGSCADLYEDMVFDQEFDHPTPTSSDWRSLQQQYLIDRTRQNSPRSRSVRDFSPQPRQKSSSRAARNSGDRLYRQALVLKKKKDARHQMKLEQEQDVKPNAHEVLSRMNRSASNSRTRPSSVPRYLQLYDHGKIIKKKHEGNKQRQEKELKERRNHMNLMSRSSSRTRSSNEPSTVPRYQHLYQVAKKKQTIEKRKKEMQAVEQRRRTATPSRRNATTPQRITQLYERSKSSQMKGKQRREQIEKEKLKRIPKRSASVPGRKQMTEPLNVGLYDRGLAKMRVLEIKRAQAAADRDEDIFKSPLLRL